MRLQMERQKENEEERVLQAVAKKEAIALEKHVQATKLRNTCEEKMKASGKGFRVYPMSSAYAKGSSGRPTQ